MKKKFLFAITLCTFIGTTVFNVQMVLKTNKAVDLTMTTLESISDDNNSPEPGNGSGTGTGVTPETGGGVGDEPTCRSIEGYWNMALICAKNDDAEVTCTEHGKISFLNKFLEGSYEVGKKYTVLYELWNCVSSSGNCCKASSQGTRIVGVI